MSRLNPDRLHVRFLPGATPKGPIISRCYTLTHSDVTGELFLTIGLDYNRKQISGWHTRLLRDEVLAEWAADSNALSLHVHCHVSGGFVLGPAAWRDAIFRRELPLALKAFRLGDQRLYEAHPELDHAPIWVHFHSKRKRYDRVEQWDVPADYRLAVIH